jgi:dihydrodipicolinate synthase/N-acetylneuraminate lyase
MGVWVETLTPMGEDYEILYSSLHSQYAHLEKSGISTIIPLSPVGEFATMIHQEKVEYLRTLGQESGKMRIFPQVGHNSMKGILKLLLVAESAGVDGVVLVPPYYYRPITQETLYRFFSMILERVRLPVLIYNMEPYSQIPISLSLIEKLTRFPAFTGIIDCGQDPRYAREFRYQFPQYVFLAGSDHRQFEWMQFGADGIVSDLGNIYPWLFTNLYDCVRQNNIQGGQNLQNLIDGIIHIVQLYPQIASLKYLLYLLGFPSMVARLPLENLSQDQKTQLKTEIGRYLSKCQILQMQPGECYGIEP